MNKENCHIKFSFKINVFLSLTVLHRYLERLKWIGICESIRLTLGSG